ncbi:hypothetical protein HOLleu_39715 [Holothuria leucospilota]|nr:hypothetical protein HOLleu_39715 [Holothuria leucospilota]
MRTENFEFYSRRPYGTPSPLSGLQAAVTLRREVWTPVAQIILALPPASVGITHFIVPTSPIWYGDYMFTEEIGKFCDRQDHGFLSFTPPVPPPPLLMPFIEQATKKH